MMGDTSFLMMIDTGGGVQLWALCNSGEGILLVIECGG